VFNGSMQVSSDGFTGHNAEVVGCYNRCVQAAFGLGLTDKHLDSLLFVNSMQSPFMTIMLTSKGSLWRTGLKCSVVTKRGLRR